MKKKLLITLLVLIVVGVLFRIFCGIFVIQPIGIIPEGATIIYWRNGLNLPFIASADGIADQKGDGVSILGRAIIIGSLAKPIKEREITRFGYSEKLYLISTGGKEYEK